MILFYWLFLLLIRVEKPKPSNFEALAKFNALKANLCLLFELQRVQAEALYELQGTDLFFVSFRYNVKIKD